MDDVVVVVPGLDVLLPVEDAVAHVRHLLRVANTMKERRKIWVKEVAKEWRHWSGKAVHAYLQALK